MLTTKNWIFLAVAIAFEVVATSMLKSTEGFTRLWSSVFVILFYSVAFYFLSLTLRTIPVGVVYAIWSGAGIALVALIGWLILGQTLSNFEILGITLIFSGVIVLNIFS